MKANEKPERRYHLRVRNRFDNGGSLSIMNGLDRYASPDLRVDNKMYEYEGFQ